MTLAAPPTAGASSATAGIPTALPALRAVSSSVAAGLKLKDASSAVLGQLAGNAYGWVPESSCLTTAINSSDGTPCTLGDASSSTTVVLFGDSSADEWALDLGELATTDRFKLVVYVHAACPVGSITVELQGGSVDPTCAEFRSDVLADLEVMQPAPALVIVSELRLASYVTSSGQAISNSSWSQALTTTIQRIEGDGLAVASLHGLDVTSQSPASCIASHPHDLSACMTPVKDDDPGRYDAATAAGATAGDAADVDLQPLFCTSKSCPAVVDGEVTHAGNNHVTESYAAKLTVALGELVACVAAQSFSSDAKTGAVVKALVGKAPSAGFIKACKTLPK